MGKMGHIWAFGENRLLLKYYVREREKWAPWSSRGLYPSTVPFCPYWRRIFFLLRNGDFQFGHGNTGTYNVSVVMARGSFSLRGLNPLPIQYNYGVYIILDRQEILHLMSKYAAKRTINVLSWEVRKERSGCLIGLWQSKPKSEYSMKKLA